MEKVDYSGTNAEIGKYPSIFQTSPWKIKKMIKKCKYQKWNI